MEKNIILIIYRVILNILNFKMKNNELYLYVICGIIVLYLLFTHFNFKSKLKRLGFLKSHRHIENFNTDFIDKSTMSNLLEIYVTYKLRIYKYNYDKLTVIFDNLLIKFEQNINNYLETNKNWRTIKKEKKKDWLENKINNKKIEIQKQKNNVYSSIYNNLNTIISSEIGNKYSTNFNNNIIKLYTNITNLTSFLSQTFTNTNLFKYIKTIELDEDEIKKLDATYKNKINTSIQNNDLKITDEMNTITKKILDYYTKNKEEYNKDTSENNNTSNEIDNEVKNEIDNEITPDNIQKENREFEEQNIYNNLNKLKQSRRNLEYENNKPSQKYFDKIHYLDKLKNNLETKMVEETENIKNHEENVKEKLEKMESLQKYMNNMLDNKYDLSKYDFKSIKSLQNGLNLSIKKINNKNEYLIGLNKKCITLDNIGGYDIKPCDETNINQYFNIDNIQNDINYKYNLEPGMILNRDVNPNGDLKYPFSILKSVNHQNCLQNNHNKISVLPCQSKKSQRWFPSKETIQCDK